MTCSCAQVYIASLYNSTFTTQHLIIFYIGLLPLDAPSAERFFAIATNPWITYAYLLLSSK